MAPYLPFAIAVGIGSVGCRTDLAAATDELTASRRKRPARSDAVKRFGFEAVQVSANPQKAFGRLKLGLDGGRRGLLRQRRQLFPRFRTDPLGTGAILGLALEE